jgi:hypothetical protein
LGRQNTGLGFYKKPPPICQTLPFDEEVDIYYSGDYTFSLGHRRGGFSAAARRNHPFNEPAYGSKPAS